MVLLLGSLILGVFKSSWLRKTFAAIFSYLKYALTSLATWLLSKTTVQILVLALLLLLSLYPILKIIKYLFRRYRRHKNDPDNAYNEDTIFGVIWRWNGSGNQPYDVMPFCPNCDNELVYREQRRDPFPPSFLRPPHFTQFICDNCNFSSEELHGNHFDAIEKIEREICRRFRIGHKAQLDTKFGQGKNPESV